MATATQPEQPTDTTTGDGPSTDLLHLAQHGTADDMAQHLLRTATAVAPRARKRLTWDDEQRGLIRRLLCTNPDKPAESATDDEFNMFMATCERLQLDPMARQVHFMKRGSADDKKGRAEVGIDGFRLVAERTGDYAGQTPREWCDVTYTSSGGAVLTWYEVWPFPLKGEGWKYPLAARVGVYRVGFTEPLYAVARWDAYRQNKYGGELNTMWAKMGPEQLGKCAEALALRQAFPNELGGVYTSEEMAQADEPEAPPRPARQQAQRPQAQRPAQQTSGRQSTQRTSGNTGQAAQATEERPAKVKPPLHALAIPLGEPLSVPAFPYGALRRVRLAARYTALSVPDGNTELVGEYVVPLEKLQEAERKASDRHAVIKDDAAKAQEAAELVRTLGELADEMSRRADEDEAAGDPGDDHNDTTEHPAGYDG